MLTPSSPGLCSSRDERPAHRQIFDAVVPGVLGRYDLPDLVAALAPRPVSLTNVRSPLGTPVFLRDVRAEYEYATAAGNLKLSLRRETDPGTDLSIARAYRDLNGDRGIDKQQADGRTTYGSAK